MRQKYKIGIIDAEYGGVESRGYKLLTAQLASNAPENFQFVVYQDNISGKNERLQNQPNAKTIVLPLKNKGIIGRLFFNFLAIGHAMFASNAVIILGVGCGIFLPFVRFFSRLKIIVNIDSLQWNDQVKGEPSQIIWKAAERLAVKSSHKVICGTNQLHDYLKSEYKAEGEVISYGSDYATSEVATPEHSAIVSKILSSGQKFVLCRTRITPFSRVEGILNTFSRYPRYALVIVGNWLETPYSRGLYEQYHRYGNIHLLDYSPSEYTTLIARASIFLYNFSFGGTYISLLEAMHSRVPVIAFESPENREITSNKAFYFSHSADLIYILHSTRPSMLQITADNMALIARQNHRWSTITEKYFNLITELASRRTTPVKVANTMVAREQSIYANKSNGQ
ncbi:MAG: glycosyltransferase [Bacteroidia bacterium]|nr:glycosyltransferase [Bacteroidia bacterium]